MNHMIAELPSALRVSSQPSSSATGSMGREVMPMMVIMAYRPPVSCGLTGWAGQIRRAMNYLSANAMEARGSETSMDTH